MDLHSAANFHGLKTIRGSRDYERSSFDVDVFAGNDYGK